MSLSKSIKKTPLPKLPTAAFPEFEGEVRTVYRAKKRPMLVISTGGLEIPKKIIKDKPRWQTDPTILAAPYYGASESSKRAGFSKEFVERVRRGEYPNFHWDVLPLKDGASEESILRLDHIQPVGRHHDSYEWTKHCLSDPAMEIIDQWLHWLIENELPEESELLYFREQIAELEKV